mmetsp:Transcript_8193/g.18405  ORF Transcript_8193/g.18405 Transcript_8193/m.18405 type:complete len:248 (-) Transcript_8193:48-791(-)
MEPGKARQLSLVHSKCCQNTLGMPLLCCLREVHTCLTKVFPPSSCQQLSSIYYYYAMVQQSNFSWHQDGQFWERPKHNVLSILHAQATPPSGGETGFADLRAARATLSKPLLERAEKTSIKVSVRDIGDFKKGTEEDLAAFPDAQHPILDHHTLDGGPQLYVGSPHMAVSGLETPEAGRALLDMLLMHATSPSYTYFHAWDVGDVIIWDNTQTLHHSMPYNNDGTARRELYRTQSRVVIPESKNEEL